MIQHWPVNRDFFAFCKEVWLCDKAEIKHVRTVFCSEAER